MEQSFLHTRLEKARAVPPAQRSPEVAAFVETYQLVQEVEELLTLPQARSWRVGRERQLLTALKLVRCHCISPPGFPPTSTFLNDVAYKQLFVDMVGKLPVRGQLGQLITALLEADGSLLTLLKVAAGLGLNNPRGEEAGLLVMANGVVRQLQQQEDEVRRQLAEAQAQLPEALVTYEQLAAFFVYYAHQRAALNQLTAGLEGEVAAAFSAAVELLPLLVPECPLYQHVAATSATSDSHPTPQLLRRREALFIYTLQLAERQRSDLTIALCGYELALQAPIWARMGLPLQQGAHPPSAYLGWLQQAKEARRRCVALLPTEWVSELKRRQEESHGLRGWLERALQQGGRWQALSSEEERKWTKRDRGWVEKFRAASLARVACSACGEVAAQLMHCSGCKAAHFCSKQCQMAHWPSHRDACKAAQQACKRAQN